MKITLPRSGQFPPLSLEMRDRKIKINCENSHTPRVFGLDTREVTFSCTTPLQQLKAKPSFLIVEVASTVRIFIEAMG